MTNAQRGVVSAGQAGAFSEKQEVVLGGDLPWREFNREQFTADPIALYKAIVSVLMETYSDADTAGIVLTEVEASGVACDIVRRVQGYPSTVPSFGIPLSDYLSQED